MRCSLVPTIPSAVLGPDSAIPPSGLGLYTGHDPQVPQETVFHDDTDFKIGGKKGNLDLE